MSAELPDEVRSRVVFANGNTHPQLGARVAELLGIELSPVEFRRFADTETYVRYEESVRGKNVIAFQTHASVNDLSTADSFYQHLQMVDAAVRGHAEKVMAVAPNLFGSRQDRQARPREAVSADLNLETLQNVGASHFVTVDVHDIHTLNSFRKPGVSDQLTAQPMLRAKLSQLLVGDPEGYVMVSPDEGHSKAIRIHAEALGIEMRDMIKNRASDKETVTHRGGVNDVDGRVCFIMDDMIGTGGTHVSAAEHLHDSGAEAIYLAATHGHFSDGAAERLIQSPITQIYVTDTVPIRSDVLDQLANRLQVISAAEVLANGLYQILVSGGSVSELYGGQNYS